MTYESAETHQPEGIKTRNYDESGYCLKIYRSPSIYFVCNIFGIACYKMTHKWNFVMRFTIMRCRDEQETR